MLVDRVIAGVVVAVATLPAKPFADAMDALVTVPALPHVGADAPLEVNTCPEVPAAVKANSVPLPMAALPAVGVLLPLMIMLIKSSTFAMCR